MAHEVQSRLQAQIDPSFSLGLDPIDDSFKYDSFYLLGLVHIFVRLNYKQQFRFLWPDISYFNFKHFEVEEEWHFFKWRNEGRGNEKSYMPKHTKSWKELRSESENIDEEKIPQYILQDPIVGLLFLQFFPHRVTPDFIKFLDDKLRKGI